ncbi:M28 family peptidase [Emticicia sp. CRIBPO]|uniref:M28 family peptidase n=1 Tax=Emticicia sp. CRIBPO TaxID=2683258 RepID=UPI00141201ED|nr:M28 family peptidase [Emticicia sp. CRIBPO]NBA88144.1 M28 family peptidase [Emticicia sp. CRIBPO]
MKKTGLFLVVSLIIFAGCRSNEKAETTTEEQAVVSVPAPAFSSDSAFHFLEKQLAFGPRVPNTPAHVKTAAWLIQKFKSYGFEVTEQNFKPVNYEGKALNAKNIIASTNPAAAKRVLLAAHWDTRPIADKDDERQTQPIPGANDGASGVAVLLEIARIIHEAPKKPEVGIDIILFDAEDWGEAIDYKKDSGLQYGGYLLGSDYWSKNLHKPNYTAFYGILLDMVGAKNATFRYDETSMQAAPSIVKNVWNTASQLGFSQYFLNESGGSIYDDHVPVIANAKIPMIDIIDLKTSFGSSGADFFKAHHTHDDDISAIDKNTLKAVGQTVLQVLYNEGSVQ